MKELAGRQKLKPQLLERAAMYAFEGGGEEVYFSLHENNTNYMKILK